MTEIVEKIGNPDSVTHNRMTVPADNRVAAVLENEAILRDTGLLTYLTPSDLLTCRLVSSTFHSFSTSILLHQKSLHIPFIHSTSYNCYQKHSIQYKDSKSHLQPPCTLQALTNTLLKSPLFPCASFCFYDGHLRNDDIQSFFKSYGHQLKSLSFNIKAVLDLKNSPYPSQRSRSSLEVLRHVLCDLTPNIESLQIWSCYEDPPPFPPSLPRHIDSFPYLSSDDHDIYVFNKTIYLNLLQTVLESAVNLKKFPLSIYLFRDREIMDLFLRAGKLEIIEKIHVGTYDIYNYFDASYYNNLFKIKSLDVKKLEIFLHSECERNLAAGRFENNERDCEIISKILGKTRLHLENLKIHCFPRYFEGIRWERMENLKEICFYLGNTQDKDGDGTISTQSCFNWSTIFPQVNKVRIEMSPNCKKDLGWEKTFFKGQKPTDTVTCLCIKSNRPIKYLEKFRIFAHIFPKVRRIELSLNSLMGLELKTLVRQFRGLETIKLGLPINCMAGKDVNTHEREWEFVKLLSGICERKLEDEEKETKKIENLPGGNSQAVSDLSGLRILELDLIDTSGVPVFCIGSLELRREYTVDLTPVTGDEKECLLERGGKLKNYC